MVRVRATGVLTLTVTLTMVVSGYGYGYGIVAVAAPGYGCPWLWRATIMRSPERWLGLTWFNGVAEGGRWKSVKCVVQCRLPCSVKPLSATKRLSRASRCADVRRRSWPLNDTRQPLLTTWRGALAHALRHAPAVHSEFHPFFEFYKFKKSWKIVTVYWKVVDMS